MNDHLSPFGPIAMKRNISQGHTLIELMIAILVGMFLVAGAFTVLAQFEGHKRTTTAMNDAMQSGNYGLFTIDKLIRSSGTGMAHYGQKQAWGCGLNFVPTGASFTVDSAGAPSSSNLPDSFGATFSTSGASALRLVPAVAFPGITNAEGKIGGVAATSDVLMVMLGGGGFADTAIDVDDTMGGSNNLQLESTVGFKANDWVLVAPKGGLGACLITQVNSSYSPAPADNIVLTINSAAIGSANTATMAAKPKAMLLGGSTAADFMMYAVGNTGTANANALLSLDLLNSAWTAQKVTDDVVLMRVVYGVDPLNTGTMSWVNPAAVSVSGTPYDFSAKGLLKGDAAANTALQAIRALRVAMIVRAPLNEKDTTILPTYTLFDALDNTNSVQVNWDPPTGENYHYRQIETTIPLRNMLLWN
jgi:type IV pilus assembly protein PilW